MTFSMGDKAAIMATLAVGLQLHATECPPLNPIDDGNGVPSLVLSEISPPNYIELYNATSEDIDLGFENYWLLARPTAVDLSLHAPQLTVPAEGFATIPFPPGFIDNVAGGEIVLYGDITSDANFFDGKFIVDFVCWGANNHLSVKVVAEAAGKWEGPCPPPLILGTIQRLQETAGTNADDYTIALPASPLNCAQADGTTDIPADSAPAPERLLHLQHVGGSSSSLPGGVSANVCSVEEGWNIHVVTLASLVQELGPDSFDWWGHNPGGIWPQHIVQLFPTYWSDVLFDQLAIARTTFPALVDYGPISEFAQANGIDLYGYIGFPLCEVGGQFVFDPVPEHCDPDHFMDWYGELVEHGFRGVAHDFGAGMLADSPALGNFAALEALDMDAFIEPVPWRTYTHLLGLDVVAEQWSWEKAAIDYQNRYSESEIIAAGGRTVHLVIRPDPTGPGAPNIQQWRFEKAISLLLGGRTVAVNLNALKQAGYPIKLLKVLSQMELPFVEVGPE